jgi:signal transduction histidine kinase
VALRARALSDGVWVEVVDTGCGIYPEDIPLLLQGQRARPHLREPGQGAGLGLRICQELLHKMDSTLQIESRLGSGSTFYFRLPLF